MATRKPGRLWERCLHCKVEFLPLSKTQTCCSRRCWEQHYLHTWWTIESADNKKDKI